MMNFVALFLGYVLLEGLTFWAVASLLGAGWALIGLLLLLVLGTGFAMYESRKLMARAVEGTASAGQVLGDNGLITMGSVALALPGYLSTLFGLVLIFGPTRGLIRRAIATRLQEQVDSMATSMFSQSRGGFFPGFATGVPQAQRENKFGTFGGDHTVIDSDDIAQWESEMTTRPEDKDQ